MKVLFVTSSPLHKMHLNDMYINEISDAFESEIWDISYLYGRGRENVDFPDVLQLQDLDDLNDKLDELKESAIAITNVLIYDLHVIYDVFHKRHIPLVSIDKESIIFWLRDAFLKEHSMYVSEEERKKFFWKSNPFTRKLYSYLEYQHVKFDYILGARNYFPDATKHFVHIHSLKYDEYLRSKEAEPVLDEKYILFMDAGLAHLPAVSGKPDSINREEYLADMNRLFKRLESEYKLPVVIAAHPKSEYQENDFGDRKIILYKTPALLKYAEFVLAHYSTSLIDLVLQKKPVIFLYSESYMNSPSQTILINSIEYAKMLNAPLVDLKKNSEFSIHFDEEAYNRFIEKHVINKECYGRKNADLIIDFLKKRENEL